ncbi:MAG TPA: sulfotransferase domain-containing protein [Polyangia bacterium]|nr:sulfotransferase domain-containing protein [Polyangia bacterium]
MGAPPWIKPEIQKGVAARNGDVWIAVPAKSGTNWMMNIVHQLLTGGSGDFDNIYGVVPWPEFVERPGQPAQEVLDRIAAMPAGQRRAFKTHAGPPDLPFVEVGSGKDVRYVVVGRNPEEALVSFKLFLDQHTDAFYDLWKVPRAAMCRPDFETWYREVAVPKELTGMFFGPIAGWWPLRHEKNVLFMHFADLKRDLAGATRKVADFLGIAPTAAAWARIDEHVSFDWMKRHESKFEPMANTTIRVLEPGGMMRKGKTGASREDGMTDDIAQQVRAVGAKILRDQAALAWMYGGGAVV